MGIQTKDYSHKAHKCLGKNGYKVALQDMTIADAIALHEHMEHMNHITFGKHAQDQNKERNLNCTIGTFKEMLTDIWNVVELQIQAGNKKALLLREDQKDYALCACIGLNGYVVTVYGNRLDQKHANKNPKMYKKGGNVAELLK